MKLVVRFAADTLMNRLLNQVVHRRHGLIRLRVKEEVAD